MEKLQDESKAVSVVKDVDDRSVEIEVDKKESQTKIN